MLNSLRSPVPKLKNRRLWFQFMETCSIPNCSSNRRPPEIRPG